MSKHENQIATQVAKKITIDVSLSGLEELVHELARTGTSRGLMASTFNYLIVHYNSKAGKGKKVDTKSAKAKEAKERVVEQVGKKTVDKVNGLQKLANLVRIELPTKDWKEYAWVDYRQKRLPLERAFEAAIEAAPGENRGDKVKAVLNNAGLTPDEVKQSRAYFPKVTDLGN